jgi:hypothetical protein
MNLDSPVASEGAERRLSEEALNKGEYIRFQVRFFGFFHLNVLLVKNDTPGSFVFGKERIGNFQGELSPSQGAKGPEGMGEAHHTEHQGMH